MPRSQLYNKMNIKRLIFEGEGVSLDFKKTITSCEKIAKTMVSFANNKGGRLLIGVLDDGTIKGVKSEDEERYMITRAAHFFARPALEPIFEEVYIDDKLLVVVEIEPSTTKPHYALGDDGKWWVYIRVKDKSIPIPKLLMQGETDADLEKLLASRHVKTLITYLREQDSVTAKVFSRIINISEKRAERMLHDLAEKQVLLKISRNKPEAFSLKWAK